MNGEHKKFKQKIPKRKKHQQIYHCSPDLGIVLIQMVAGSDRDQNVDNAARKIRAAKKQHPGTRLVCLPECFNSPYGPQHFAQYAEAIPTGYTSSRMASLAQELSIYVLAGTIPERCDIDDGKDSTTSTKPRLYNTCAVFGPNGELVARHRKAHLYDIDLQPPLVAVSHEFYESASLTPGNRLTTFRIDGGVRIGVGICFDMYFDEYARALRQIGCDVIVYPAAFNPHIGPMHWDLLNRARAADNQVYTVSVAPARVDGAAYVSWGHSMVSDPWGRIVWQAGIGEEVKYLSIGMGL